MRTLRAEIIDRSTGDVADVEFSPANKVKFTWVGGWMLLSFDGIRMIEMAKLRGQSLSVLLCMMRHLKLNTVHNLPMSEVASLVGIDRPAVSRALVQLEQAGLVMRGNVRGTVYLSPHVGFRGSALQQRAAVKEWDLAHQPVPVPRSVA